MCYQGSESQRKNQKKPPLPSLKNSQYAITAGKIQEATQIKKIHLQYKQQKQHFKTSFNANANSNYQLLKVFISKIEQVQDLQSIFNIKIEDSIKFQSLSNYFLNDQKNKKSENSYTSVEELIQKMIEVYLFFIESKKHEKQLIICIQGYLEAIKQTMNSGHKDVKNHKFPNISSHLKKIQYNVYVVLEDFLKICRQRFNSQTSRILLQSFAGSISNQAIDQELNKLRQNIKYLEEINQQLRKQKQSLHAQNQILLGNNIPKLKEALARKQAKEIEYLQMIKLKFEEIQYKITKYEYSMQSSRFKKVGSSIDTHQSDITKLQNISKLSDNSSKGQNIFSTNSSSTVQDGKKERLIKDILQLQKSIQKQLIKFGLSKYSMHDKAIKEERRSYQQLQEYEKVKREHFNLINSYQFLKEQKCILEKQSIKKQKDFNIKIQKYKAQIANLNQQLQINKQKLQIANQKLQISNQKLKHAQGNIKIANQTQNNVYLMNKKLQKVLAQKEELNAQISKLKIVIQNSVTYSIFQSKVYFNQSILKHHKEEKKFLKERIQCLIKRQIQETKLLFSYKKDHKINFHDRIDNHQNILLVVQTKHAMFAGFYSGPCQDNTPMTQQALIISLDNKKEYRLNNLKNYPNKDPKDQRLIRGMIYDKYYIIFGNAQIRIKTGQKKVFSNFGISNSYFNHQNDKTSHLLHQDKEKEVQFIDFEIYQIIFNNNEIIQVQR